MKSEKKTGKYNTCNGRWDRGQATETSWESEQISDLIVKDFKVDIKVCLQAK